MSHAGRAFLLLLGLAGGAGPVARAQVPPPAFTPPPESAIPDDALGQLIRQGEAIFRDTGRHAARFVGNDLQCGNCHLDGGRQANAAPLWAAYVSYPAFRPKTGQVNTFAERVQDCFRYSMNGTAPPLGDPVLVALESYAFFLARGAPTGMELPGRGYPRLPAPDRPPDFVRGAAAFAERCAACHGPDGAGRMADDAPVFPALWGPRSFNWGAGMARISSAAGFIQANMPFGQGGTLSDQQAWDLALFVDSHDRPQDPRYSESVEHTRAAFHDTPDSMYGLVVNGVRLGGLTTP
jgi:thiosulfate dehydrogenase